MDLSVKSPALNLIKSRTYSFGNGNQYRTSARKPPFNFHLESSLSKLTYSEFFDKYLMPNKPCIFPDVYTDEWRSRVEWADKSGKPNFQLLKKYFGQCTVPVANCNQECYSSHPKKDIKFDNYIKYWEDYIASGYAENKECLYLKDWHFNRDFPLYKAYTTPEYFTSDWLNEFWDTRVNDHDDYRFVYMGPKGSWTPFHADVFRSYSWSANILGRKKWIMFPPGEEECLKDKFGNLVYDVTSEELNDNSLYSRYCQLQHKIEIIQEPGEMIFVPSGWHHQVHNLEDTISINHNWLNGCNVDICWSYIKQCLMEVQSEISDCKDMEGWHQQCQLILKTSSGIDYTEFFTFMKVIANKRIEKLVKYGKNKENNQNKEICGGPDSSEENIMNKEFNKAKSFELTVTDTQIIHSENTADLGTVQFTQDFAKQDRLNHSATECTCGEYAVSGHNSLKTTHITNSCKCSSVCLNSYSGRNIVGKPDKDLAIEFDKGEINSVDQLNDPGEINSVDQLNDPGEINSVDQLNDSGEINSVDQLNDPGEINSVDQLNNPGEINSIDQLNDPGEMNSVDQLNDPGEMNSVDQLNDPGEMNSVDQLNYVLFDLCRVKDIIEDMLKTQEFLEIDSLQLEAENLLTLIKSHL